VTGKDLMLLMTYAEKINSRRWAIGGYGGLYDSETALKIIKSCLALGTTVTGIVTVEAWYAIISRLITLEDKVTRMDAK